MWALCCELRKLLGIVNFRVRHLCNKATKECYVLPRLTDMVDRKYLAKQHA